MKIKKTHVAFVKTSIHLLRCICFVCLMASCSSHKQKEVQGLQSIHVKVDNLRNDVYLSEFAEAKLVPLPTSDDDDGSRKQTDYIEYNRNLSRQFYRNTTETVRFSAETMKEALLASDDPKL